MPLSLLGAQDNLTHWLHGEHEYQFGKNVTTHSAKPAESMEYIIETETPNKWHRFSLFYRELKKDFDTQLQMQAAQQLLKVTAGLRAAFVWGKVLDNESFKSANAISWSELDGKYARIKNMNDLIAPNDLLSIRPPVATRVQERSAVVGSMFTHMSELTLRFMIDEAESHDVVVLPTPGVSSGTVQPWADQPH